MSLASGFPPLGGTWGCTRDPHVSDETDLQLQLQAAKYLVDMECMFTMFDFICGKSVPEKWGFITSHFECHLLQVFTLRRAEFGELRHGKHPLLAGEGQGYQLNLQGYHMLSPLVPSSYIHMEVS